MAGERSVVYSIVGCADGACRLQRAGGEIAFPTERAAGSVPFPTERAAGSVPFPTERAAGSVLIGERVVENFCVHLGVDVAAADYYSYWEIWSGYDA